MSIVVTAIWFVVALIAVVQSIVIVKPRQVKTITRLGKYVRYATPGLNFKIPFFIEMVDVTLSTALLHKTEEVRVKTVDNAYVLLPLQVFYQVVDRDIETVGAAAYNLEDAARQILALASVETRSHATSMTLDELFKDKNRLEDSVMEAIKAFASENGYNVKNVVVDEPTPSDEIQRASNDVIASLRLQDAASAKAEAIRIERVGEAKADAEALRERAKAFADSRETIAAGMVKAARTMGNDFDHLSEQQIVSVLEGVDWRDALISVSKGNGSVIVVGHDNDKGIGHTAALIEALKQPAPAAEA